MKFIDTILDSITMYRLVLYYLLLLLGVAFLYSLLGILSFQPVLLLVSVGFLVAVSWITNRLFAWTFRAPANVESVYISALILALIIPPIKSATDLPFLFWAAVITMASKYIFAIYKKHVFNPVAIGVVITSLGISGVVSWWVGTVWMLPFSLLGILIVKKIQRYDLVFYFLLSSLVTMLGFSLAQGSNILTTLTQIFTASPIFFFAFVMLTEPLTTPPTKALQSWYGVLTGVLFAPQFHIGTIYTTPEQALVLGNIFSYIVSPKHKIISTIQQKLQIAPDMMDLLFLQKKKLVFVPGQYMEWTVPHKNSDARGNRRYFTIASSPTENTLRLGVRFYPHGSSYKKALMTLDENTQVVGAQLSGDFTLPKDVKQKLVFLAGGIGITPFRSMIKYLVDVKQQRVITLFYANKTVDEIVYRDVFTEATQKLGIQTIYTLTDSIHLPQGWQGEVGRIDAAMIRRHIPDFMERVFYISGPHSMVDAYQETLKSMGVPEKHIVIDFFPGFA